MTVKVADHFGMCFGVRDALRDTEAVAGQSKVTVLGQLVHNPVVSQKLDALGVETGKLDDIESAQTERVVITAHGASDRDRDAWGDAGYQITDTTCPLVKKAHSALAQLVVDGWFPVVVGKADHVEVRGLIGDFPETIVVLSEQDLHLIPNLSRLGVISQTTQPIEKVEALLDLIRSARPDSEVKFVDTVCQPTKNRQKALNQLCQENELVIVVGGHNSNNTRQLVEKARRLGVTAHHVALPEEVETSWFHGVERVGITAGTSTLQETVYAIRDRIESLVD